MASGGGAFLCSTLLSDVHLLQHDMDQSAQLACILLAVLCATLYLRIRFDTLRTIPTIGPSAPVLSYIAAYKFLRNAQEVLQEGYNKHKVFKVAMLDRWIVVVSGAKMNEELRRLPDEAMSFIDAADEITQSKYTIAPDVQKHPIHVKVIKEHLTRNLAPLLPDIAEEVDYSFQELIPAKQDEWLAVPAYKTMSEVIARASNRVFVGISLCRNPQYLEIASSFAAEVLRGCTVMGLMPNFLKPIIGPHLPWSRRAIKRMAPHVIPIIEQRQRQLEAHGEDWTGKPNDLLMWLVEEANHAGLANNMNLLVQSILTANFVAVHTSSITFTHALYHLAANSQYTEILRDEVESIIQQDGWTKIALGKMWKLDSFLKESQRVNGTSHISVMRIALKDVVLSDGTMIPAGTFVAAAATSTHLDEENYENAEIFNPFRFSDKRLEDGEKNKHQYVSTSSEYIGFGHGKHACPGRFFAANELKVMLAHIVLNYDVMFENEGKKPDNIFVATTVLPAPDAKVLFRKRSL
ncbi:cytochrome P450 [Wolfiporia cocos MD-104 SS10]|uniref:Cytochrome P450 n=1 Tax=Wolfiporia cocos (strain MD-104) TaxID=742152 RepID=A0A2H3JC69_WOLCO|nr:cytochrome P450 [Wolfiporia cocos MD-104 SS10]